jgi:hypothetical protein
LAPPCTEVSDDLKCDGAAAVIAAAAGVHLSGGTFLSGMLFLCR